MTPPGRSELRCAGEPSVHVSPRPATPFARVDDSDFFLRKAIGWALRDYARTNPAWVRSFAETHELSPLSRREALKHLS
jgi:hypothetical protein